MDIARWIDVARYVFGVLLVTFLPPALLWWFLVHPFVRVWRRVGTVITLAVMLTLLAAGIAALMTVRNHLVGADLGTHVPVLAGGIALMVVAGRIAVMRGRQLTFRTLVGVPELEGEDAVLLDEGIYGRVRHPRYVEIVVGVWAYALFANYVGAYVVALFTMPLIHLIVLVEERELHDRFGARYADYAARVPRYLPRRSE